MAPRLNPAVAQIIEPPVGAAKASVAGRSFPDDHPLIDLAQAVPSYPPAESLRSFLSEIVMRPDSAGYASAHGVPHVREAVAAYLARGYDAPVSFAHVLMTAGCNEAFCLAIGTLAGSGDEVILPEPYYFNHDMWLRAQGIRAVPLLLEQSRDMVPDPEAAARLLSDRTRAIVLVTPNNPTGATYLPDVIAAFLALGAQHDVAVILDETYRDFRPVTAPPHSGLSSLVERDPESWPPHVVQLFSFSKSLALAGYRAGALVGHPSFLAEAAKLADCITIGAPRVSQEAVGFGVSHLADWLADRRLEMLDRVASFRASWPIAEAAGWQLVSAGAFFAYVRHPLAPARISADEVTRRLADDHDLLAIPGTCFGADQADHVRLAFGNIDAADVPEAVARLAAYRS